MTIKKLSLPLRAFPKPRGKLSRNGHIYHSSKPYVVWNKQFKMAVQSSGIILPEDIQYYCFKFFHKPRRGHAVDGENCQGAVQDALVKSGLISDDNINVVTRWYGEFTKSDFDRIDLYFCQTKKEFLYVMGKFMD